MNLATILAAINAGVAAIPEGLSLIQSIKATFEETDQAAIDQALADSTAEADAQHARAQAI